LTSEDQDPRSKRCVPAYKLPWTSGCYSPAVGFTCVWYFYILLHLPINPMSFYKDPGRQVNYDGDSRATCYGQNENVRMREDVPEVRLVGSLHAPLPFASNYGVSNSIRMVEHSHASHSLSLPFPSLPYLPANTL